MLDFRSVKPVKTAMSWGEESQALTHKLFDDCIARNVYPQQERTVAKEAKTLNTRYIENVVHPAQAAAEACEYKHKCLAALQETNADKIESSADIWMTDQAVDCST